MLSLEYLQGAGSIGYPWTMVKVGLKDRRGAWGYVGRNPGGFTAHCTWCQCERQFVRSRVRNGRHFIASLLTLGLWLIGWLAVYIETALRPWRCAACGWHKPEFRVSLHESRNFARSALNRKRASLERGNDKTGKGPWPAEQDDTNFPATS